MPKMVKSVLEVLALNILVENFNRFQKPINFKVSILYGMSLPRKSINWLALLRVGHRPRRL